MKYYLKWFFVIIFILLCIFFCEVKSQTILNGDRSSYWTGTGGGGGSCDTPTTLESCYDSTGNLNNEATNDTLFQSFSHSQAFTMTGDSIKLSQVSGVDAGDSVVYYLFTDSGSEPGSIVSGSRTAIYAGDLVLNDPTMIYFDFDSDLSLSGSTTYWKCVTANGQTFTWRWAYSNSGTYANGNAMYVNNGGSRSNRSSWDLPFATRGCND